jgi:hypothetical protein
MVAVGCGCLADVCGRLSVEKDGTRYKQWAV